MSRTNKFLFPFILVTSLFFLWAFLHNINPVLIPHLKKACNLSDTQSVLIDTAVYLAYFSIALPAGWFMHRFGYKKGILFGLFLYGAGSLLFIPAANALNYSLFLAALFIIASGATFLETVANPYITKLGDEKNAAQRLNFAQSFNGVGAVIAPLIGGKFILSGVEYSKAQLAAMDPATLSNYLHTEASTVKIPYLIIAIIVFVLMAFFFATKLPEIREAESAEKRAFSFKVFRHAHVKWAVIAQFFYVGAQAGVGSFVIRFAKYTADIPEKRMAFLWGTIALVGFTVGRFSGTFLMKYIKPAKMLLVYALMNVLIVTIAVLVKGNAAVYLLMAVPFFMSVMYPTIFAMGIAGLGEETKIASSFIVMAIAGGAVLPLLMGAISDATNGNIQLAYIIPLICFAVVAFFAYRFKDVLATVGIIKPEAEI